MLLLSVLEQIITKMPRKLTYVAFKLLWKTYLITAKPSSSGLLGSLKIVLLV